MTSETENKIIIKKYSNRRLYNTESSSYITLDDVTQLVRDKKDFIIVDAKTGDDLTRSVLTQIIVEEESKGQSLLPISFLKELIGFYGGSLETLLPGYLEQSMKSFVRNQSEIKKYMQKTWKGFLPLQELEKMGEQNLKIFEDTMKMFSPFKPEQANQKTTQEKEKQPTPKADKSDIDLSDIEKQIASLKDQLDHLKQKK